MLVTETTGIKLLPKIIVLNPKDGSCRSQQQQRDHRIDISEKRRSKCKKTIDTGGKNVIIPVFGIKH